MAFAALDALREGYQVYPVVDAIAGTSVEAHRAGLERVVQAGGRPISWVSLASELQRDNDRFIVQQADMKTAIIGDGTPAVAALKIGMVMAMEEEPRVVDNPEQSRYELWVGSRRAGLIQYLPKEDRVLLVHTEVDPAFAGQGLGERLVAGGLEDLRARGLKLVPLCPFVRAYLRRHPDQADLVAGDPAVPE